MKFTIREGKPEDCKDIERMIMELAVYEKMPDQVKISHKELERDGFGPNPYYQFLVAEVPEEQKSKDDTDHLVFFFFYCHRIHQGKGIGKALMATVAKVGKEKECVRLQLSVLDWNKPSLEFYLAKGAEDLTAKEGWHHIRFHGEALNNLAQEAP
ncbi:diamine acetyltransferase 2b isoform X2 [Triplophysa dalaica]|uniref:diamine acetyltransferase 2b isoform X2 n=1 Tax=Triplophysa dalaica TaxID=1582913 RepID=UPI0024E03058|nr:diamine acetyltransferase 2b isoform X2 [Triplophysa dalaica]